MTKLAVLIFLFSLNCIAGRGQDVGNGGDAISCSAVSDNFLNGTYSLDYILTLQDPKKDLDSVAVKSWDQSADRIYNLLLTKIPSMASYFAEYRKSVFNTKDFTQAQIWEATPFGLIDLKDENIAAQIPVNCKVNNVAQISQAVVRQFQSYSGASGHVVYKYMPDVVDKLNKENALQLSYLLIHEWLWDFSSNVERNRRVNQFLHSSRIETMSKEDIEANLKGMGFFIPNIQPDVFESTSCQGNKISFQDLQNKFVSKNITKRLEEINFFSRRRNLNCPDAYPECGKTWLQAQTPYIFRTFPFFTTVSWTDSNTASPIQIVSPGYMQNQNMSYRNGDGQISCQFIKDEKYNLECQIQDEGILRLFADQETDISKASTKIYGVMTDECLRIEGHFNSNVPFFSPRGPGTETLQVQNVLFMKYRLNQ